VKTLTPASGLLACLAFGFAIVSGSLAQQTPDDTDHQPRPAAKKAAFIPEDHRPQLFFKEEWNHSGTPEHPISQSSVANPNLELKLYGDQPKPDPNFGGIWENKRFANDPAHTFTGTCRTPCGLTFRDKNNYADVTGLAKIQWNTKAEGFHVIRPLIKLADGAMLVGDHGEGYAADWHISEFGFAGLRWRQIDPATMITLTGAKAGWITNPDLSKVDEIGFVDLMPGSGHGNGGWTDLAWMAVYGNPVKR
jgi:hypothetical protein